MSGMLQLETPTTVTWIIKGITISIIAWQLIEKVF